MSFGSYSEILGSIVLPEVGLASMSVMDNHTVSPVRASKVYVFWSPIVAIVPLTTESSVGSVSAFANTLEVVRIPSMTLENADRKSVCLITILISNTSQSATSVLLYAIAASTKLIEAPAVLRYIGDATSAVAPMDVIRVARVDRYRISYVVSLRWLSLQVVRRQCNCPFFI